MCRVWQNGRIEMVFYRTRIALALARQATSDVQKRAALLRAERDCRDLENDAPWSKVLAQLARATLSHAHGRTDAAIAELDAAAYALRECHMHHYAAAADYRRGMLLGESGRGLVAEASAWMRLHHMLNPSRMADLLAPGPWTN
jgi:ATP/maltotriose-dependent transcriptional regulator MalT